MCHGHGQSNWKHMFIIAYIPGTPTVLGTILIIDEMNWPGNQILNHESSSDNKRLLLNYNSKQFLSCNDSITPSLLEKMFLWYLSNPGKHCNTLLMGWQARQVCKLLGTNKRQCIGVLRGEKTDMETKKTGILFIVT